MGLENGYQTVCGASGGHLSGGERQRISIARAMLKDAPIVILDEATSYTDPENEAVIQSALGRLVRGKTLLVIAHRLSTIADADQIIVVNQGKIEATGTQAELLASCPFIKPCGRPTSASKTTGRWRNAQDTEKIFCLLRGGQPQAVYNIYLAGRGQRHLLCHAYSGSRHRHSGAAGKERHYGNFMTSLGIIVISLIITIAINMKATMLQTRAGYRACANKRIEIAEHLRYLPMGWFNDSSLGEVTSVTTNTMENMANVATRVVMVTTRGFLTSGIIAAMMFPL